MQESGLVLSQYEEINSLLYKPIIATQRIKYTCINVSTSHIVLGSTSGSLFLFTREPCTFQQVIPLSEGPVTHVQISPDEKTVALSTKRGSVCIVSLKPSAKLISISNEHLRETVTSLCWNSKSSEIYVGDNKGKISTIVLSIFTVNGMFQAPSCALMHLDSSIVQLDYNLHYLLVSTLTRCYVCDTSQEQFKQIGNKARDGVFGACFMKKSPIELEKNSSTDEDKNVRKVSLNSIIGPTDEESVLIYSARPGLRLWEVNLNGTVLKTHQFKDALAVPPSEIFKSSLIKSISTDVDNEQHDHIPQIINFSHLFVVSRRYLLSHTNNSLCIIDPTNAAVVLWTDKLDTIAMAQVVDDKIYLMNTNGTFQCLMLSSIDYLIIKLFETKLYHDCYNACMTFRSDLLKLIESNNSVMLEDFNDCSNELVTVLQPIISVIQSNYNTQPKRLNSGIVVVNSGHSIASRNNGRYEKDQDSSSDSEIVCRSVIKPMRKLENKNTDEMNIKGDLTELGEGFAELKMSKNGEDSMEINGGEEGSSIPRRKEIESATAGIQSDIQPLYTLISTLKSSMTLEDLEDTIFRIVKSIQEINFKYEDIVELKIFLYEVVRSIERLYFHALLENISPEVLMRREGSDNSYVVEEVLRAFVDLNGSDYSECTCGFPMFRGSSESKFGDIGQLLVKRFSEESEDNCVKLCKSVPYLWRNYLRICIDRGERIDHLLRLCLQTRDNTVLSIILPLVEDNSWDIVADCDDRMRTGRCISCGRDEGNHEERIDWSGVAHEILKREGIHATMKFLTDAEKKLPRIKLKESIFQSLICTKLLSRHGFEQVVEFNRSGEGGKEYSSICSKEARENLADALEKDLDRPVNNRVFGSGAHHWGMIYKTKSSVCPCCTLSLQTPVLLGNNGISIFPCGHAYHVNCLIQKKITKCYLHSLE
ncbi:Hermansky-Pudlak syndrome 5 protein homolog [Fopius arisanus]|uniref:Hermansky-Pudlak syndrome 5 protein homolog n=1 Tax=Fopius arisanus TaxID=64838 RepID=A0A0C9S1Q5_9HYME|nr:PREDICTED: Hermansky-Pudlak syndrome 5 protein homolog [Fopius arisanus]